MKAWATLVLCLGLNFFLGCTKKARIHEDSVAQQEITSPHDAGPEQNPEPYEVQGHGRLDHYPGASLQPRYSLGQVFVANRSPVLSGKGLIHQEVVAVAYAISINLKPCYDSLLHRVPRAAGQMAATAVISSDGHIQALAMGEDTVQDPLMRNCFLGRIQRWKFPILRGNESLVADLRFNFQPLPFPNAYTSHHGSFMQILAGGRILPQFPGRGHDSRHYIEAQEGQEYRIRIQNPYAVRVAVAVAVDGLNSIDAAHTTAQASKKWIIEPYQSITISGWQVAQNRLRRFVFATEEGSYGARLGKTKNLGDISVAMFRERLPAGPIKSDFKDSYGGDTGSSAKNLNFKSGNSGVDLSKLGLGAGKITSPPYYPLAGGARKSDVPSDLASPRMAATAMGPSATHAINFVSMTIEPVPAIQMTVRYEYREVLEKMGILPSRHPTEEAIYRRDKAQGFQKVSFSPEVP